MTVDIATYQPDTASGSVGSMSAITGGHLDQFRDWAKVIAAGSVIPDSLRGKPADVFITVMHGLDLGLRPMQALNLVYVVKGRPSLSAEGMRSLILDAGHELEIISDDKKATVRGKRRGSERWVEASYTIEQAKKAKLGGANWDSHPEDMLVARASTRLAKRYFPDITNGLSSVEELLDMQEPVTRPSLAQAAQQRTAATTPAANEVTGEVVDDQAEAERLRQEVARLQEQHTAPAQDEPAQGTLVDPEEPPYRDGWDGLDVTQPGSKGGAR